MPSSGLILATPPGWLVAREVDPLTTHRQETWRVDILDFNDQIIDTLDNVTGGEYTYSVHATIRSGGSLTLVGQGAQPDWHRVRLRPWYILDTPTGERAWPMGIFIPSTPGTNYADGHWTVTAELYDKLLLLDRDEIHQTWDVDAGENAIEAARGVIERTARVTETLLAESDEVLASPMVWEVGASGLQIVNDLLASINYFSLVADRYGMFRADPYVRPQDRGVAWRFIDNDKRIHVPEFSHEVDGFNVPNEVVLVGQSNGETPALTARARNEDPNSPWSIPSRGGVIAHTEVGVEASSQFVLDNLAARRLAELTQVTSTFEVQHAWVPLELNDAVLFGQPGMEPRRCVVQAMRVRMYPGQGDPGVTTTLREVVS